MKILHVSKLYFPFMGGIETVVKDLVEEQAKSLEVERVDVLAFSETNTTEKIDVSCKTNIIKSSSIFKFASTDVSLSFPYHWIRVRNKYDVVHVHVPNPIACFCLAVLPPKGSVVVHWHSDIVKQKWLKILHFPFQHLLLSKSNRIIVTSLPYLEGSKDLRNFVNKVDVVPIGIDKNMRDENLDVTANLKNKYKDKKVVFALGRHVGYKGFDVLIKSCQYLPDDYIVLLGGGGPLTDSYKSEIKNLGLEGKIELVGKIPESELNSYYQACDLFVLPSVDKAEAFGVVQLEAMSQGKPIVCCDIPGSGVPWVNSSEITGKISKVSSPEDLAEKIIQVAEHHYDREEIINYFENNFSRHNMSLETLRVYNDVIN